MPLRGMLRLPQFNQPHPVRGPELPGEELQTFEIIRYGSHHDHESRHYEEDTPSDFGTLIVRKIGKEISEEERSELELELSKKVVHVEVLQDIVSRGHLDDRLRPVVWKLLLGYLRTDRDAWKGELAANRLRYAQLKREILVNPSEFSRKENENDVDGPLGRHAISHGDHPLKLGNLSIWCQYFKDAEIKDQIDRDLQRTHPDINFFSGDNLLGHKNQGAMRNILLLFAKLNPEISYVQGMNEVLAPLYYVISTDSDEENADPRSGKIVDISPQWKTII